MSDRPVAIVTGAARGIGRATAVEFARRGYRVALLDVLEKELAEAAAAVTAAGGEPLLQRVDLQDLVAAEKAVRETSARWGRIDVLVNNAAWRELLTMRQISLESWEKTLRISLTAPAFLSRWAAEVMEKQKRGVIINVSSVYSRRGAGISAAYVAAKGALDALTFELAALYGPAGVRVVAVNLGAVNTEMSGDYSDASGKSLTETMKQWNDDITPLQRWATPEEIAKMIALLASDDASFVTGTTVYVDGGMFSAGMMPHSLKKLMNPGEFR